MTSRYRTHDLLPSSVASCWLERRTGIARSRVQIPLKSWIFFGLFLRNCINCVDNCEDHSSLDFIFAALIYDLFHIHLSPKKMIVDTQDAEDFFAVKSTTDLFSV